MKEMSANRFQLVRTTREVYEECQTTFKSITKNPIERVLKNKGLTSLDDIDLTNVTYLDVSENRLKTLPILPDTITTLILDDNHWIEIC